MSYVVVAQFRVLSGQEEAFEQLISDHAYRSRVEEEGCLIFDICRDVEQPGLFLLYEVYRDAQAYQAHRADPHHARVLQAAAPLLIKRQGSLFWSRQVLLRVSPAEP